uniref:Putative secreted protein n=1 Tax=Anopheles triannulatus TaxID=58253 RepID=A0A2M4B6Q4_9DIPT
MLILILGPLFFNLLTIHNTSLTDALGFSQLHYTNARDRLFSLFSTGAQKWDCYTLLHGHGANYSEN